MNTLVITSQNERMCGIQNLLILKVLKSTTTSDHVTLYLNQRDGCNMQTMGM